MIRTLAIRNLAVIESVTVEFEHAFNILTGETGAGKSILVEAVGLLLGGRASQDLVRTGADLATVEALFDLDGQEIVVRREITAQGRSRAFISGALATAGALKDFRTSSSNSTVSTSTSSSSIPTSTFRSSTRWAGLRVAAAAGRDAPSRTSASCEGGSIARGWIRASEPPGSSSSRFNWGS